MAVGLEKREEDAEGFVKTSTFTKLEEKVEEELEIDHGASWQKGQKSFEQRKGHRHAIRMWKSDFFLCLRSPSRISSQKSFPGLCGSTIFVHAGSIPIPRDLLEKIDWKSDPEKLENVLLTFSVI